MKTRWLINLILLTAVVVLAAIMRFEITSARFVPQLTDLLAQDVYQVQIARQGEPTILLTQDLTGWRMDAPFEVDGDAGQIAKLLGILETPVIRTFPAESAALKELELAPAKLTLQLDETTLAFGGVDPMGQARYVESGGLVHLIEDRFFHFLIAPPIDYVSLKVIPRDFSPVFGRLSGVPVASDALKTLDEAVAERVERLASDLSGSQLELKAEDGTPLRFMVSDDRRRWARLDQQLLYVMTNPLELPLDPGAQDPTPPAPAPSAGSTTAPSDAATAAPAAATPDPYGAIPTETLRDIPPADPNRLVPEEAARQKPPVVRLTPDGREIPVTEGAPIDPAMMPDAQDTAPFGFGQDPFAPDPPAGAEQ